MGNLRGKEPKVVRCFISFLDLYSFSMDLTTFDIQFLASAI